MQSFIKSENILKNLIVLYVPQLRLITTNVKKISTFILTIILNCCTSGQTTPMLEVTECTETWHGCAQPDSLGSDSLMCVWYAVVCAFNQCIILSIIMDTYDQ